MTNYKYFRYYAVI